MSNAMSLKAIIRNIAKRKNIPAQVILQNYCRAARRHAASDPQRIGAGGRRFPLTMAWPFEVGKISPIREDDIYGGYRVMLNAHFDTLITPLSIDVSTGDAITPHAVQYRFSEIFDDEKSYELWAYNIETVMAEKVETILRRGVFNTRPRDFYDAYILATTQKFDKAVFAEALNATAAHRGTARQIADVPTILHNIESSRELKAMWEKYRKQFAYAAHIEYRQIMNVLKTLVA